MSFIADSIRIAKDGTVTSVTESVVAAPSQAPASAWTAKRVCAELCAIADEDASTAKTKMLNLMIDHNFRTVDVQTMLDWIDRSWAAKNQQTKVWAIVDFFHNRCP